MTFALAPGKSLNLAAVAGLVMQQGLSVTHFWVAARGEASSRQGQLLLQVDQQQSLVLQQNAMAKTLARALQGENHQVSVSGFLFATQNNAPLSLAIERFQLH